MSYRITFLGTGSSGGVPRIGNNWGACDPKNKKNRRLRCSILVERQSGEGTTRLLVDCGPDLRYQMLRSCVEDLDGVYITHTHADHFHGIDDLRAFFLNRKQKIPIYAEKPTGDAVYTRFPYIFTTPQNSDYPPIATLQPVSLDSPIAVKGRGGSITLTPFRVEHDPAVHTVGILFDFDHKRVAYVPDVKRFPETATTYLSNLELLILDALQFKPHSSHLTLDEALECINLYQPKKAVLTNLHIALDYEQTSKLVPVNTSLAFDGREIVFNP